MPTPQKLSKEQANELLKKEPLIMVAYNNKKVFSIKNIAAFIFFSAQDFEEFKIEFKKYVPAIIKLKTIENCNEVFDLAHLLIDNPAQLVYLYKHGVITSDDIVRNDPKKVEELIKLIWQKQDNDCFFFIKKDNNFVKEDFFTKLFFDERTAIMDAEKFGGTIEQHTLVEPLYNKMFSNINLFKVNEQIYTMSEILSALFFKFQKQCLPFNSMRSLLNMGLSIYEGEDYDGVKVFKQLGCATFFTYDVSEQDLPISAKNLMPENAKFVRVEPLDKMYDYLTSKYIFLNGARHTSKEIFYNALSGYDYKKVWTREEIEYKLENISRVDQLFVILSDNMIQTTGRIFPQIININFPTIRIFSDYGRAVMFCQNNNKYSYDGKMLIGELNRNVPGYTLLEFLSQALIIGIKGIEIDPGDEERLFIPLKMYFDATRQRPLEPNRIYEVENVTDEERILMKEIGFNPMFPI